MRQQTQVSAILCIAAVVAVSGWASLRRAAQSQAPTVIEVTAKKYEFDPSPIHVKQGTSVELKITAADHTHGFQISLTPAGAATNSAPGLVFQAPEKCWTLEKGQVTTIAFLAKTAGTYPFHCCHFCGFGHKGMKGELIVDP